MKIASYILRLLVVENADTQACFIRDGLRVKHDERNVAVASAFIVTHGLVEVRFYGLKGHVQEGRGEGRDWCTGDMRPGCERLGAVNDTRKQMKTLPTFARGCEKVIDNLIKVVSE